METNIKIKFAVGLILLSTFSVFGQDDPIQKAYRFYTAGKYQDALNMIHKAAAKDDTMLGLWDIKIKREHLESLACMGRH